MKKILSGRLMALYLFIYAVIRFILEYLRGDEIRGRYLCFSTSQWISLLTIVFVSAYIIFGYIKRNKKAETN